jgi:rhodanese-related sulfurtransferase
MNAAVPAVPSCCSTIVREARAAGLAEAQGFDTYYDYNVAEGWRAYTYATFQTDFFLVRMQ